MSVFPISNRPATLSVRTPEPGSQPPPGSPYIETLYEQLRKRPDLVVPLQGSPTDFALADGSILRVKIDYATHDALLELDYPLLGGNGVVAFELLIQSRPQGQRAIIRTNANVTPPIIVLEKAELSVVKGMLNVNGRNLPTLFGVPFNSELANAGSELSVPPPNVKLPDQWRGLRLEWDMSSGPNSVWIRVDGTIAPLRGRLRQKEDGSLVMFEWGKGVKSLEDAIGEALELQRNGSMNSQ